MASPGYQLSSEILGHSGDVRVVRVFAAKETGYLVATASRDGTACVWSPEEGSSGYVLKKLIKSHTGYVSSLCVMPANMTANQTLLATGGQDSTILVHSLEEGVDEPVERYVGHKGLVTCMIYQHNQLISGSWDSMIRVWKGRNSSEVIEAHKPAVWTIAGLYEVDGTKRILSGGADKIVRLWEVDTRMCVQEYRGHTDVVRDIKIASHELFLSACNDCVIRKWNIHSGQCLREMYGHEAFVYSLALLSCTDFVSCGEDGSVRVWKEEACQQVLHIPATSVWSVACAPNGDVVAGSSDGVARVFTVDMERVASMQVITVFNSKVKEHRSASKKSDIEVSKLPGRGALQNPGRSSGDTLMINNDGVPEVYQWDAAVGEWNKIGNAIGRAPDNSKVYNGKEYDFVFDIELDEGPPPRRTLKLPYDRSTDPYVAAEDFLSANNLPAYYLDQVAEFITQNAGVSSGPVGSLGDDPFTGGARYVPESGGSFQSGSDPYTGAGRYQPGQDSAANDSSIGGAADPFTGRGGYRPTEFSSDKSGGSSLGGAADPFTGRGGYHPADFNDKPQFTVNFQCSQLNSTTFFPMANFKFFESSGDYGDKVMGKVREFNEAVDQGYQLTEDQLEELQRLCKVCTGRQSSGGPQDVSMIRKLLSWPVQHLFPGLDILRLCLLDEGGHKQFIPDADTGRLFVDELLTFALNPESQSKNLLLVLRTLANVFACDLGCQVMHLHRVKVFADLSKLYTCCTSRPSQIAMATVVLNYSHYYSHTEKLDGYMECTEHVCKVLESTFDAESKFRALISAGSLAKVSKDAVKLSAQPKDLLVIVQGVASSSNVEKVKQCAHLVLETLK